MKILSELPVVLGGNSVRTKSFSSRPLIGQEEIDAVVDSMKKGLFSKFVGTPPAGTRELLTRTSEELRHLDAAVSFLGGPNVRRFEADWARLHEVSYAITVNSATSGLTAALMAINVGPGCEVITTPLSFTATATAIVAANAIPVFADIDENTLCLDPASVEEKIGARTKCILPVHWCGNAGGFDRLMAIAQKHQLPVIEDASQSPGTQYQGKYLGVHGVAGVFSFSEPKNVTTGEGGMVITSSAALAEKIRLIRNHGECVPDSTDSDEYVANSVGYNFRMVELVAAIGWVQTSKLKRANEIRRNNYNYLRARLENEFPDMLSAQIIAHRDTYAAYTAVFRWLEKPGGLSRDAVAQVLRSEGIPVATGVGKLMSNNELFLRRLAYGLDGFPFLLDGAERTAGRSNRAVVPVAERIHDREYLGFFLMGFPNGESDMDDIVSAFAKIRNHYEALTEHFAKHPPVKLAFDRGRGD